MATVKLKKLPGLAACEWHGKAAENLQDEDILPHGVCPWLYHSVYPYFLGMLYGAKFDYNDQGDVQVCCPATKGVDVVIRKRDNDGTFDPRIEPRMKFVIFAEVVNVRGDCPYAHRKGQRIPFPTSMPKHFMCPAAFNNVFPLMRLEPPECIEPRDVRCPDWANEKFFDIRAAEQK